jgi:hypothetical protein
VDLKKCFIPHKTTQIKNMKKMLLVFLIFFLFFNGCINSKTPNVTKLIKDYYKKEEGRSGGSHIYLKDVQILKTSKNKDTSFATAIIKGRFSPNQVPGAPLDSDYTDTSFWRFYKKDGKWESDYDSKPWQ